MIQLLIEMIVMNSSDSLSRALRAREKRSKKKWISMLKGSTWIEN